MRAEVRLRCVGGAFDVRSPSGLLPGVLERLDVFLLCFRMNKSISQRLIMFRRTKLKQLKSLDKRMWRLEAMIMGSTIMVVAMVVTVFMGIN